jgi:lycopene beta-cyclase
VSNQTQFPTVDYLFAGAGASATLVLMSMEQRGLLQDKNIVILDPDSKSTNDKTYCFWNNPNEGIALECRHLISYQWENSSVNLNKSESLYPMRYFHISSCDLYSELQRIISTYSIKRIQSSVLTTEAIENGIKVKSGDGDIWQTNLVFDSRPPQYLSPQNNEAHLLQSFIGFVIDTEIPIPDVGCIDLMDFGVEQQGWTQFIYVLPFAANKILVELTRFGRVPISQAEAEPILNEYITKRFGNFTILDIEKGCIPMSTAAINVNQTPGIVPIGGRAGAVKPSTGYAFKNMFRHAEILANCLQKGIQPVPISQSSRFKFYDRLLLLILSKQPAQGKPIFLALFKKNKTLNVLQFLDEKTSIYQDLRILSTLPFKPFLHAWRIDAYVKYKALLRPTLLLLLSFILLLLQSITPHTFKWVEPVLFFFGLLCVGIPHGAVDHLLDNGSLKGHVNLNFLLRYLGAAIAYLVFWLAFPNTSLLLFLIYSVWHFGQSDMEEWQPSLKSPIKNGLWGSLLLGIILCGHAIESGHILENMGVSFFQLTQADGKMLSIVLVFFALVWGLWERKLAMLLSCCMLAISIQLPLITSFGLYFIGQHSLNGWAHLKKGLHTDNRSLFLKALPFTAGAFLLFAALLYSIKLGYLNAFNGQAITSFFVFIACISFPHVITMHRFYKKYL